MKTIILILVLSFTSTNGIFAQNKEQNKGFIYGVVETRNGERYEGAIRWGKEEAFWFDHFNSEKTKNEYLDMLSNDDMHEMDDTKDCNCPDDNYNRQRSNSRHRSNTISTTIRGKTFNFGWSSSNNSIHTFSTEFGNIKVMKMFGGDEVDLVMRDGSKISLEGGSNDIEAKIKVMDSELGEMIMDWDRVRSVTFKETPTNIEPFGEPIYGKVTTRYGDFEGYIQWDHDERLSTDKIDGDTRDGDLSIFFGKIKKIVYDGRRGCDITLKTGRIFYLDNSNDVDSDNRGVIVNIPEMGRVDIPFRFFISLEILPVPTVKKDFNFYKTAAAPVKGTVVTQDGQKTQGLLSIDLDETYTYEIINGEKDHIKYFIPLAHISKMTRRDHRSSIIKLKNGEEIVLSGVRDVDDGNEGVLVMKKNAEGYLTKKSYIPWRRIDYIDL